MNKSNDIFNDINIQNSVMLAPMAGVADAAFRILCRELIKDGDRCDCGVFGGGGFMFTEMVSAKGLCYGDAKSFELARVSDIERPIGIQIFGSEPNFVARAIELLNAYSADLIDINMGCPMPKVTKNGDGAALMLDPARAQAVVKAAVGAAAGKPVSVKIRSGWDEGNVNAVDFAKCMEGAGAAMITVHGRTREQMYGGMADWRIVADVKRAVSIPVVGNGDVCDARSAIEMLAETGCDGVMIGRAIRGKPWLLRDIGAAVARWHRCGSKLDSIAQNAACPPVSVMINIMKRHLELAVQIKGERMGVLEMRKHMAWYIKGIKGAAALRNELFRLTDYDDILRTIENIPQ